MASSTSSLWLVTLTSGPTTLPRRREDVGTSFASAVNTVAVGSQIKPMSCERRVGHCARDDDSEKAYIERRGTEAVDVHGVDARVS